MNKIHPLSAIIQLNIKFIGFKAHHIDIYLNGSIILLMGNWK
ncbi:hypothetical protein J2W48_003616 [Flavobacterium piscis]|uniref:Uncharacterized protein n=1 Tax=Flavobacterium piscis TaxID=1114874 RepID=A0ABU1YBQ5_9FLAO|nr:hypothetical protein [Flavobacterium piscis]